MHVNPKPEWSKLLASVNFFAIAVTNANTFTFLRTLKKGEVLLNTR